MSSSVDSSNNVVNIKNELLNIPKPNIKQHIVNPAREKSILYTFSIMMMHAPTTAKFLGEEKTMCHLQKEMSNFTTLKKFQMPSIILFTT